MAARQTALQRHPGDVPKASACAQPHTRFSHKSSKAYVLGLCNRMSAKAITNMALLCRSRFHLTSLCNRGLILGGLLRVTSAEPHHASSSLSRTLLLARAWARLCRKEEPLEGTFKGLYHLGDMCCRLWMNLQTREKVSELALADPEKRR